MAKILIVDDEPRIRELIRENLQYSGYKMCIRDRRAWAGLSSAPLCRRSPGRAAAWRGPWCRRSAGRAAAQWCGR